MSGDNLKAENAELKNDLARARARVAELEAWNVQVNGMLRDRNKEIEDILGEFAMGTEGDDGDVNTALCVLVDGYKALKDNHATLKKAVDATGGEAMVMLLKYTFHAQREMQRLITIGLRIEHWLAAHHVDLVGTCKTCGYKSPAMVEKAPTTTDEEEE